MDLFDYLLNWKTAHPTLWRVAMFGMGLVVFIIGFSLGILGLSWATQTPAGVTLASFLGWLLAPSTNSVTWVITRSAGIIAYLLLWLSTAWGLAVSSRILEGRLHGAYTYDFHQFISLLAIGFTALHVLILLIDSYAPFSVVQILVPFLSTYRPLWVGVGVLTLYIVLLVTITFYIRDRIGQATFRAIHVLSLLAFVGAAVHGLLSGADSPLAIVKLMYAGTFLSVVFLTTYWMVLLRQKKLMLAHR